MEPTIMDGDLVFAERMSITRGKFARGEVVCIKSPLNPRVNLCKRIAYIEHDPLHTDSTFQFSMRGHRIQSGHCFILGDNAYHSTDSRHFGPIPLGLVTDRVVLRVWPPNRIGWVQ